MMKKKGDEEEDDEDANKQVGETPEPHAEPHVHSFFLDAG